MFEVECFYLNILNRTADQTGLDNWLNVIRSSSGARVALGFLNSQEFINLQLDNTAFIYILYSTLFDRLPDQDGLDIWMAELEAGNLREMVVYGFLRSQEFQNLANSFSVTAFNEEDNKLFQIKSFVRRFYQLVLNREPDTGGFNDWSSQLSAGTKAGGEIAEGFFNSPEFLNRNTTDTEFVDIAYSSFFDREADEGGKQSWINALNTGSTRLDVVDGFIGSQEFINLAATFGIEASRAQNNAYKIYGITNYDPVFYSYPDGLENIALVHNNYTLLGAYGTTELKHIDVSRLIAAPNCGLGHLPRKLARKKLKMKSLKKKLVIIELMI